MAAAQNSPASAESPAAPQPPPVFAHVPAADAGKTSAPVLPVASLSPQQQRLLDQASQLLTLAQKLKAEVDKTNQYTLSLTTLRRADDIEKLANTLQKQIERENR
jgi:hypothetical protein